jgi:hypothetical protein
MYSKNAESLNILEFAPLSAIRGNLIECHFGAIEFLTRRK